MATHYRKAVKFRELSGVSLTFFGRRRAADRDHSKWSRRREGYIYRPFTVGVIILLGPIKRNHSRRRSGLTRSLPARYNNVSMSRGSSVYYQMVKSMSRVKINAMQFDRQTRLRKGIAAKPTSDVGHANHRAASIILRLWTCKTSKQYATPVLQDSCWVALVYGLRLQCLKNSHLPH